MKSALTVLLLSTALWGQLYSSGGPVVNNVGQPVAAQIAVCTTSPTIIVAPNHPPDCAVFAQTYSDATLSALCNTSPTTLGPISGAGCTNPGKTDSRGNYVIFAPSNVYYLEFYGYGITTYIMPVAIPGSLASASFGTLRATDFASQQFPVIDVRAYGAVGDAVELGGPGNLCTVVIGTPTLTCPTVFGKQFAADSVGKMLVVRGAGSSGPFYSPLVTTIAAYISPTQVTMTANAVQSSTTAAAVYGTDNAAAFCAAAQCTTPVYTGIYLGGLTTGRTLYVPGGAYLTSKPLYCRNNLTCIGAGQASTQIMLGTAQNDLPDYTTVNFASNNITPVICMGNATGGSGTCTPDQVTSGATGSVAAYNLLVDSFGSRTVGILATSYGMSGGNLQSGVYFDSIWVETWYGIVGYHTSLTNISRLEADLSDHFPIVAVGDGNAAHISHWLITDSQLGLASNAGVWIDGAQDVNIVGNNCTQATKSCVFLYSSTGQTAYRISIGDNDFFSATGYAPLIGIDFEAPCMDCSIVHNKFGGNGNDIVLGSSASGTTNLIVSKNTSYKVAGEFFAASTVTSGSWTGEGNVIDTPGQYGVVSVNMGVKWDNNICINPFTVTGPLSSNAWQSACVYFAGASAYNVEASNNTTATSGGTKYPTINVNGSASSITSSTTNNTSNFVGCATCIWANSSSLATSFNELATNYGSGAGGAFVVPTIIGLAGTNAQGIQVSNTGVSVGTGLPAVGIATTSVAGQSVCIVTASTTTASAILGHCTSVVGSGGACTCAP